MIVNYINQGWQVIYQLAHGLLAGQIAMQFRADLRPEFWCETLTAIVQHDDRKAAFHGTSHLTEAGAPQSFTEVEPTAAQIHEENLRRLNAGYKKHRWIGLLQSMHIDCLYAAMPVAAPMRRLIDRERKHRRQVLRELNAESSELEYAYEFLHWCDRCSLILCQDEIPAMNRRLEVIQGLTDETYFIHQLQDATLTVEPWPFAADSFEVGVEYRILKQIRYDSDEQLAEALDRASVQVATWRFKW